SEGVIGQRHFQGSLYVALDSSVAAPVVALTEIDQTHREPDAPVPYLVSSRWRVYNLERSDDGIRFDAQGFGPGEFVWKMPKPGRYVVTTGEGAAEKSLQATTDSEGLLRFVVDTAGEHGVDVRVRREDAGR